MTVTAQAGVNGRLLEARAERPRADASPLPRLGRMGDGRRLHRRPRVGRALHALRQDRGPAADAARRDPGHGPHPNGRRAAARRGARADAAVRRVRGHPRRDHAARRSSSCRCRPSAASPRSRSRPSTPGSTPSGGRCRPATARRWCACTTRTPRGSRSPRSSARTSAASTPCSPSRARATPSTWRSAGRSRSPPRPAASCWIPLSASAGGTGATTSTTLRTSPSCPPIWGTLDVVATYSRIEAVYAALHKAVREPYADAGLELRMHFSHWYPWGTMIYGRFVVPDGGPDALALHDRIWEDGMTAALDAGGVMNDHHGVGHQARPLHAPPARRSPRRDAADQGRAGPEQHHEPRKNGPLEPGRRSPWRSRWPCTTGCVPSRSRRRSPGSVAAATTASRSRASRPPTTPTRSRPCSTSTASPAGAR